MTVIRFVVIRHGVIAASRGGKAKTVSQMFAIFLYIIPVGGLVADIRPWIMALAVVLTVVTGIDYVVRAVQVRRTSERTAMKQARRDSGR